MPIDCTCTAKREPKFEAKKAFQSDCPLNQLFVFALFGELAKPWADIVRSADVCVCECGD